MRCQVCCPRPVVRLPLFRRTRCKTCRLTNVGGNIDDLNVAKQCAGTERTWDRFINRSPRRATRTFRTNSNGLRNQLIHFASRHGRPFALGIRAAATRNNRLDEYQGNEGRNSCQAKPHESNSEDSYSVSLDIGGLLHWNHGILLRLLIM